MTLQPRTLFGRTALTLAAALLLLLILTLSTVAYYILIPLGQRSAGDLAALVELSSQTWASLSVEHRAPFARKLAQSHDLLLLEGVAHDHREQAIPSLPYFYFFESALSQRLGTEVELHLYAHDPAWYWVDIPIGEQIIHVAISSARMEAQPPKALLLILLIGSVTTIAASIIIARRTTLPLARLAQAADSLGRSGTLTPLSVEGPSEQASLARAFNEMAQQINALLENRTVMLSGISHDLRTPLTRATLALEMLSSETDAGLHSDLEEMNRLIALFLEMSKGLSDNQLASVSLSQLLSETVAGFSRSGAGITLDCGNCGALETNPIALRRSLTNLIENAVRYGAEDTVDISCRRYAQVVSIDICDRGPGIPVAEREAVLRPFYRLEGSRSLHTGGSGLGLAIVQQLASRQGWRLQLLDREGGGLLVRLQIPVKD